MPGSSEMCQELALVRDDTSAVVGLITATDALEAVMGEMQDPLDIGLQNSTITTP